MKLIINTIIIVITLSSCATTSLVQNNPYYLQQQQAMQTEISETELQQLLNFSDQELEQFRTNYISNSGAESWSDWKKTINYLKTNQEQEYFNDLSQQIKMSLGTGIEIEESEMAELLQLSHQEFDAYKKYVITELGENGWRGDKSVIYGLRNDSATLHLLSNQIKERLANTTTSDTKKQVTTTSNTKLSSNAANLKIELDEIKYLLDEGLITKEEYETKRKKILSNYK